LLFWWGLRLAPELSVELDVWLELRWEVVLVLELELELE
jgi:hypothetical protein